jgi:hypothetical protein
VCRYVRVARSSLPVKVVDWPLPKPSVQFNREEV